MQQHIQQMVADGGRPIEPMVQQKRCVQGRPDHVIEMTDKDLPAFQVWVLEDCQRIVVVKHTDECAEIHCHRDHAEHDRMNW